MSNVLQRLKQTESGYQRPQAMQVRAEPARAASGSGFFKTVILFTPAILVASWHYLNYQPDTSPIVQVESVKVQQAKILDFPQFGELVALPAVDGQPVENTPQEFVYQPVETESAKSERSGESLDNLDLSELSPELAQMVQSAISDTSTTGSTRNRDDAQYEVTELVGNERRFRGKLPALNLQTHMYASSSDRRWVKVNGQEVKEGDWVDERVKIESITPRTVVVDFEGEKIEIPALYEWR
ncbi:general secretion pathway protein GspB [Vibrio nigripulchritudo]|uniref:general secretion pathway protein GspB n=1 Tax=Vibrio nigripulchritudo TaxID=28173 RepID=UPI0024910FC5|nr:general secretion pathway protein GspB [Vibrio nigripulchritudo]BDU38566.1 general secretion pathway protein GspB [Vibrio nigripulchritudo]BDU44288.1 general secretion pathway protein GspB [Vibrio nigripulchritudo]